MANAHATEAMTSDATHGHGDGDDFHPHVLPLSVYLKVFGALLVLTVVTVLAARVDLGEWNVVIALAIATTKATLVAVIFMHLFWDAKFHSLILLSTVMFMAIFMSFTSFDLFHRGRADAIEGQRPADISAPFAQPPQPTADTQ